MRCLNSYLTRLSRLGRRLRRGGRFAICCLRPNFRIHPSPLRTLTGRLPPTCRSIPWRLTLLLLAAATSGFAQEEEAFSGFLQHPGQEAYRNYAEYSYYPYRTLLRVDPRYNFFGDFLAEGFRAFRLDDQRPGKSLVSKDGVYRGMFGNLLIARSSYGRFNLALTVGDEVRTHLTPLTLQRASFNGLRWEMEFANNRITLLTSRGFDSSEFPAFPAFSTPVDDDFRVTTNDLTQEVIIEEDNPVYTVGGHWETQVGDVLTLGTTFLNQQQVNAGALREDSALAGTVPYPQMLPPEKLMLRITDDSPESPDDGATVFDVVLELDATVGGIDTVFSSDPESPNFLPGLAPTVEGVPFSSGAWNVRGADELLFTFAVSPDITSTRARFCITIANDYRIATAQEHVFFATLKTRNTEFLTLRRAPGNVRDGSNLKELELDYGLNSGQTFYGADFTADLVGFKVRGELSMNTLYRKYPLITGHAMDHQTKAWYLQGTRTFRRFHKLSFGTELFRVGAQYGGGFNSRRGGIVLYTDTGGDGTSPITAEFPLVDDNDDNDRYADDNENDFPGAFDLESGVYPGLDEDNDNIPDDDRNANGIPDFEEPFLLYHSDPQEFVYGLDMNNNGIIDVRENDNKADYPYDRDRRGEHYTVSIEPYPRLVLGGGHYRMRTLAGAGRARSTYVTAAYRYEFTKHYEIRFNHDSKRVKDSIPDSVYIFNPVRIVTPEEPPDPDPLLFKNSWVHTSFAGLRVTRYAPLNLETTVKRITNRIFDLKETRVFERDERVTTTMVNKVDYRWQRGRFTVMPMYKRLWQRITLDSRNRPAVSEVQSAPILRLDYQVTDDLKVQIGQQGMRLRFLGIDRLLAFHSTDNVKRFRSFTSTDFMLMLTLRGSYLGNILTANSGIQLHKRELDQLGAAEELKFTRFFVEVVAGFEHF